jgi:hypothetical protein
MLINAIQHSIEEDLLLIYYLLLTTKYRILWIRFSPVVRASDRLYQSRISLAK